MSAALFSGTRRAEHHVEVGHTWDGWAELDLKRVLVTLGSAKAPGLHGPGTGFLIKGKAASITSGPDSDVLKSRFSWARATLAITPDSIEPTL